MSALKVLEGALPDSELAGQVESADIAGLLHRDEQVAPF
jgi:hypothetical protein